VNLLLAGLYVLMWGSAFNAARLVSLEWPPLWALTIRFGAIVPLLWLVWHYRRAAFPRGPDAWRVGWMGVFGMGGYLACSWLALEHIPAGLVALLAACAPMFVALGEAWRGRRLALQGWVGLGVGWIGVAVLGTTRAADGMPSAEAWGIGLSLLGALLQAAGLLAYAPARARVDPWAANLGQTAAGAAVLLVLSLLIGGAPPTTITTSVAVGMLYSSLVVGMAGYALFFVVIGRLGASNAVALQLLAPPVAAVIGWAAMDERLYGTDLLGGAITLLGLLLLFRAKTTQLL
jgi:drug/metabolite transporter (DMT)-like permease